MSTRCDEHGPTQQSALTIALVGNPNCGKTTLFNALTGAKQRVGNWPGVTIERKSGYFTLQGKTIEVVDLPGVYTTTIASEHGAIDERIACHFILNQQVDLIVNIIDASNLERHLYLTTQLLELDKPLIVALNMMDVAKAQQKEINIQQLAQHLGCPVIALSANKKEGLEALKHAIINNRQQTPSVRLGYPASLQQAINSLANIIANDAHPCSISLAPTWLALRLLEEDLFVKQTLSPSALKAGREIKAQIEAEAGEEIDILLADVRYQFIHALIQHCVLEKKDVKSSWTTRIDNIVLNRFLGLPIFLMVMYALFFFSINIGGAFQDFFDISSQTLFVDGLNHGLTILGAPTWLRVLLSNGVGKGINTTITFIPVIGALFLFLAFLEDSGYMARAAFVIDRFMRALGLPGKAFVPMIVGFGCNVPAVMAARTLDNKRDRILTIMMTPFMSCGARLAIFAVFVSAFFPRGGQNIVFALYLIGLSMAMLTGFILRHTLLKGEPSPLIMELPVYHWPHIKTLSLHAWQRLKSFVFRAGKLIVPICVLIGALNTFTLDGSIKTGEGDAHSLLSFIGQFATPIFTPMGIHVDNWPATVGLVTGILAKEVVVGTLNTLYTQLGHLQVATAGDTFNVWTGLHEALASVPKNFADLLNAFSNPVLAKAPIDTVDQGVYGIMYQRFDGQIGAFAYLLFILLYFPCISTTAAMLREVHRGWSLFSIFWMTMLAYGTAVFFYQAATWLHHPISSSLWLLAILLIFAGTIILIRWYANDHGTKKRTCVSQGVIGGNV